MHPADPKAAPRAGSSYAALNCPSQSSPALTAQEIDRRRAPMIAELFSDDSTQTFFSSEATRLQIIKDQIWGLFEANTAHIPSAVLAHANAYADALALQLRLITYRRPSARRTARLARPPAPPALEKK